LVGPHHGRAFTGPVRSRRGRDAGAHDAADTAVWLSTGSTDSGSAIITLAALPSLPAAVSAVGRGRASGGTNRDRGSHEPDRPLARLQYGFKHPSSGLRQTTPFRSSATTATRRAAAHRPQLSHSEHSDRCRILSAPRNYRIGLLHRANTAAPHRRRPAIAEPSSGAVPQPRRAGVSRDGARST
jgi:hypothetical protein